LPGHEGLQKKILFKYARAMENGVIPNTIGEGGEGGNYDTADASLWFGIRAAEFLDKLDGSEREELSGFAAKVIEACVSRPGLPFYTDPEDGLISLRPDTGLGLTWMDAKIHGSPVTPRYGKPIEINCLWYNLLKLLAEKTADQALGKQLNKISRKTSASLKKFFDSGIFCDRISETGAPVREIRPNYIIGLSLPRCVFSKEEITAGYRTAKEKLLTPFGLRSLSPENPAFRGKYMGSQPMRDLAYHQGTVWA
jgi:predicted glycogen debranching enzyme